MYIQENFLALQFLHSRSPPSPNPPRSVRSKLSPARLRPVTGGRPGSGFGRSGVRLGGRLGRVRVVLGRSRCTGAYRRGPGGAYPVAGLSFLSSWVPSLVLQLCPMLGRCISCDIRHKKTPGVLPGLFGFWRPVAPFKCNFLRSLLCRLLSKRCGRFLNLNGCSGSPGLRVGRGSLSRGGLSAPA